MTKTQRIENVKVLLSNEYGAFGRERLDWHTLYFSGSTFKKMNIENGNGKTIMYEVFLSDTPSGVIVSNQFGDSIDLMELTPLEVYKIGRMVEWKRNRRYRELY